VFGLLIIICLLKTAHSVQKFKIRVLEVTSFHKVMQVCIIFANIESSLTNHKNGK
jgi:hypothetical protein